MDRIEIINYIIKKYNFSKYLEIGIRFPEECFDKIECDFKESVDPGYENPNNPATYPITSDEFFNQLPLDKKYDIIFIDGLHLSWQVDRDIQNSLNHLSENGVIVLHDCNPPLLEYAVEDFDMSKCWNGTVWKAFYKYRCTEPDLDMCVVDCDWGIGIVKKGNQKLCPFNNPYFEYRTFEKERLVALNLISPNDLNTWLDNPFYHEYSNFSF